MKIETNYAKKDDFKSNLLFPLVPEKDVELTRSNSISFELRSTPGDPDSPRYKKQVRIIHGDESPRTIINWCMEAMSVTVGLNMTTHASKHSIITTLVMDNAKTNFEHSILSLATEAFTQAVEAAPDAATLQAVNLLGVDGYKHVDHIPLALNYIAECAMPKKILQRAKRELRRSCRKPAGMKVRDFVNHLNRINRQELPKVPPFEVANSLIEDEMLDIFLYGTPKSWQAEMERQGFDPMEHTLAECTDFCERLESAEAFDTKSTKVSFEKDNSKSSSNKKKKSNYSTDRSEKKPGQKYCLLHGNNSSHSTEECHKLKVEANRLKGDDGKKNNTWTKKAQDHKDKTRRDLNAIVQKAIKKGVRKELSNIESRKRESDDDSSDGEVNLIDSLGKFDLNDVNDAITDCVDVDDIDDL